MATLSKTILASAFAAAMLASSPIAFAADNSNSVGGGAQTGNNSNTDGATDQTGSVNQNDGDSPSMDEKEACTAGMESSPQCADQMKNQ